VISESFRRVIFYLSTNVRAGGRRRPKSAEVMKNGARSDHGLFIVEAGVIRILSVQQPAGTKKVTVKSSIHSWYSRIGRVLVVPFLITTNEWNEWSW
jgi:hypothetical protein